VAIGSTIYFTASDGIHGTELWKSDGTGAGTALVEDINAVGSSSPAGLAGIASTVFFRADDGSHGLEIWKSDGTAVGTLLVRDIHPSGSSGPTWLTDVAGVLYFRANDGSTGFELWTSDGTDEGTVLVEDLNPGPNDSSPVELKVSNGTLFFAANDGISGTELWGVDAASSGVFDPGAASAPQGYALYPASPNPFHGATTVRFGMPAGGGWVRIGIVDALGRHVCTLVAGHRAEGRHEVAWDGRSEDGQVVPRGVYFGRMFGARSVNSTPLVFLK
jgi:ELWxxDGT repeat protein